MEKQIETEEIWRSIEGYEGLYQVSSLGRVRSLNRYEICNGGTRLRKGRVLKPVTHNRGYLQVNLKRDGKQKMFLVHRLVGMSFQDIVGECKPEFEIDHKNTQRQDNRAANLHWVTRKGNCNNPLTKQHQSNAHKGENNPLYGKFGKYNPKSKAVVQYDLQGNLIAEFEGLRDAERQTGISHENISSCCRGKTKTTHGYIFSYKTA